MRDDHPVARGRRWLTWSVPALVFLIAFLHRAAPGVLAKDLMQAFDASGATIGRLSATYFYAYAGFMIPGGVLIDSFGPRWVVAGGGAIMGVGSIVMGLAGAPGALFGGRLLVGLGAAVTFTGTLKIAASWFAPSHFATMSALTATVGLLGALVGAAPLAALADAVSWRGALLTVGAITLGGAGLCALVVRDRPASAADAGAGLGRGQIWAGLLRVLGNPYTWAPFLCFFFLYAAMGNFFLWSVPLLRDLYGLTTTRAALYASLPSVALLGSAPLTGYVSDRVLGRRKLPYVILTTAQFLVWLALVLTLGSLSLVGVGVLFFLMGAVGGAFVLTWPLGREVNPPGLAGIAVAVVNLGGFVGAALTQGPVGALLDARWAGAVAQGARVYPMEAYRAALALCALFVLAAVGISCALVETRGENIHPRLRPPRSPAESGPRRSPAGS